MHVCHKEFFFVRYCHHLLNMLCELGNQVPSCVHFMLWFQVNGAISATVLKGTFQNGVQQINMHDYKAMLQQKSGNTRSQTCTNVTLGLHPRPHSHPNLFTLVTYQLIHIFAQSIFKKGRQ